MEKRYFCWDENLIEKKSNVSILMHKPQKRNVALVCDHEWEGPTNGYACTLKFNGRLLFYYRSDVNRQSITIESIKSNAVICVAESFDGGITFRHPNVGIYDYNGTKNNNIVFMRESFLDNFSIFVDENPSCPEDEKIKALSMVDLGEGDLRLLYYASGDGLHFREMYYLSPKGMFDSYNVTFWDKDTEQYFLYYRAFHSHDGKEDFLKWFPELDIVKAVRDVRVATSKDFVNWTEHGRIKFEEGQSDCPLYTNQVMKYYRSDSMRIALPVRYLDRVNDIGNFKFMPLADRRANVYKVAGREGTALTDCIIMTSEDGFTFNRRDEAFLTPGVENRNNWWYGDCYIAYNLVETPADEDGAPNEISIYTGENYRIKNVNFRRYTIRLDGFFSYYAPFAGGEVLTKPLTVVGDTLKLNFASSALGDVRIALCDEDGNVLEGYESYAIFGDSVDRPVEFERPLSELIGKNVRLKIKLRDTNLYSFCFE